MCRGTTSAKYGRGKRAERKRRREKLVYGVYMHVGECFGGWGSDEGGGVEGCSGSAANSTPKPSPHSPFLFPAIPPPPLEEIYREGRQRQVHFSTNWVSQDMPHPIGLNWCESLWCLPWVLQQRSVCRDNDINLVHVAERSGPHQPTDSNANLQTQAREGEGGQTLVSNGWAFCDCF